MNIYRVVKSEPNHNTSYISQRNPIYQSNPRIQVKTIQLSKAQNVIRIAQKPIFYPNKTQRVYIPLKYQSTTQSLKQLPLKSGHDTGINSSTFEQQEAASYLLKENSEKNDVTIESINSYKLNLNQSYEKEYFTHQNLSQNISYSQIQSRGYSPQSVIYPFRQNNIQTLKDQRINKHQQLSLNTSYQIQSRVKSYSPIIIRPKFSNLVSSSQIRICPLSSSQVKTQPIQTFKTVNFFASKPYINQNTIVQRKYEDGSLYEGQLINNQMNGKGKLIYADGSYFIGEFHQDQINGLGEYYSTDQKLIYEGEWSQNKYHGRGILHNVINQENDQQNLQAVNYSNFDESNNLWVVYEGQFVQGQRSGTGLLKFIDGSQYFGGFKNDLIDGAGVFSQSNKEQVITGCWKEQKLEMVLD